MRRVAITGIGIVSPIGIGREAFWEAALAGRSGIGRVQAFDPAGHASQIAGEVRDFDPRKWMDARTAKRVARFSQFALAAARLAVDDAKLAIAAMDPSRAAVVLGVAAGDYEDICAAVTGYHTKGPGSVKPFAIPKVISNMAASAIALEFGLTGPCLDVTTACASGAHSLGTAFDLVRHGRCDAALAGGAEATINPVVMDGYDAMKAMSRRNDEPGRASRPFDRDRDGFVIGEGAGIFVLEEWETARRRGAPILAEFAGYGATCDAYHIVAPEPDGKGAAAAIRAALADAGEPPEAVEYINAHGTSTPANDVAETKAIKRALGEAARRAAISSTKSLTGHTFGAAGGIEAAAAVMAIVSGAVHPTVNLEHPDPECDLDYVPNTARELPVRLALSNSFGFGGHNAVLAFRKA